MLLDYFCNVKENHSLALLKEVSKRDTIYISI